MNDSFTSQNSAAFYQAPAPQSVPTGSDDSVVMDAPAVAQSSLPGDDASIHAYQPPAQPAQTQAQPDQSMKSGDVGVNNTATTPVVTPVVESPVHDQESATQASPAMAGTTPDVTPSVVADHTEKTDGVVKSSPEEVVRRLAERIKSYQAKQAAVDSSPAMPAAPTGNVVVTPAAPVMPDAPKALSSDPKPADEFKPNPPSVLSTNSLSNSQPIGSTAPVKSEEVPQLDSEALDAQNIFELLGVADGSDQEKDGFLDQLQQVIWEDFLENDVQLLLTKSEANELQTLLGQENQSETDRQESAVLFLEKLIPDLESIMLEKALELKREMVFERIAGMRELHGGKAEILARITEAEVLFKQDKWQSGAKVLNAIK